RDLVRLDARRDKISAHAAGSLFGEFLVVFLAADAVRVALDIELQAGIRQYDSGDFREALAGVRLQGVLVEIKQDIGHAYDQPAGSIASLEDLIELRQQSGSHLLFLSNGLVLCLLRLLSLILSLLHLALRILGGFAGCLSLSH